MTFIAIGGHEDMDGDMAVLARVLREAKGRASRVHVVTAASSIPLEYNKMYQEAFRKLGVECTFTHIESRQQANDPKIIAQLAQVDVVFFSGGSQSRLTSVLSGSGFIREVDRLREKGVVIAGTSAGAAAASTVMICGTGESVLIGAGLGLAPEVIFDTHFLNRDRLKRLFNAVADHPDKTGIGIDEDTAVVMRDKRTLEVVGSGHVTIVEKMGQGLVTRTLSAGDRYRLKRPGPAGR